MTRQAKLLLTSAGHSRWPQLLLAGALFAVAVGLFLWAAQFLPLESPFYGFDWRTYYYPALSQGWPDYNVQDGIYVPPWIMLWLWPLGWLPFRESWALHTLITLALLVFSAPRRADGRLDGVLLVALLGSHWMLRQLVDGNLAGYVIAGFALLVSGWQLKSPWRMALGVLLAATKYQESWLALIVLAIFVLKEWPLRLTLKTALIVLALTAAPMLLLGPAWLENLFGSSPGGAPGLSEFGSTWQSISISLSFLAGWPWWYGLAWLAVLGVTGWAVRAACWKFDAQLAGLLMAASLLLSPYASGLSLATLVFVGIAPLIVAHPRTGWLLLLFAYGPHLTRLLRIDFDWPLVMQFLLALTVWTALALHTLRDKSFASFEW